MPCHDIFAAAADAAYAVYCHYRCFHLLFVFDIAAAAIRHFRHAIHGYFLMLPPSLLLFFAMLRVATTPFSCHART